LNRIVYDIFSTEFGRMIAAADQDGLILLMATGSKYAANMPQPGWQKDREAFADLRGQLAEYCAGTRRSFDLLLNPRGTEFQQRVWDELMRIPWGSTVSYTDLARAVGSPDAVRAVGQANGRNPIHIIIPCHRAIGSNGDLSGYAAGIGMKRSLLEIEGLSADSRQSALFN
jgi:methylated-DNA-[protein]-cysteine S-methyltransferase